MRWAVAGLLVLAATLGGGPLQAKAEATPVDAPLDTGSLVLGRWEAGAWGRSAAGGLALVALDAGTARLEISRGSAAPAHLLRRLGEGWTVVLAAGADDLLQPWDQPWSLLEARLADPLRSLAAVVAATDPGAAHASRRIVVEPADPSSLRSALAGRGRGRGGPGEVLSVTAVDGPGSVVVLRVRSSRRPGSLSIERGAGVAVRFLPDELLVPAWPLGDLLESDGEIPGTGDPGRR